MDAIDLPNSHLRSDNGMYSRSRAHAVHSRSESSLYNSGMYMATDTQELAEFLRTSSPQDFGKFLKKSPSDDQLFSLGSKTRKSFSFLRPSASKPKLKPQVLPSAVLAKKTSWGKPYLQIQINYDGIHPQTEPRTTLPGGNRASTGGMSDFTADFGFDESLMASSTIVSPPPSTMDDRERPTLNHARWTSTTSAKTLDSETADIYRKYLNSQNCNADFDLHPNREATHAPAPTEAVGGSDDRLSPTAYQKTPSSEAVPRRRSDSHCYLSSPQNRAPIKVRKRSSSLRRTSRGSSRSSVYSTAGDELLDADGNVIQPYRKASKRAPPRPGPPPARGLPALPESRGSIVNSTAPRSFVSTTVSLQGSSIYNHRLPGEDFDQHQQESMTREQKVRAKKARDMRQVKLRRQLAVDQESVYTLGSDRTSTPPQEKPQSLPTSSPKNKSAPSKPSVPLENSQSLKGWVARMPSPGSPPKPPRKSSPPSTPASNQSKPLPPPPSATGSSKTEEEMQLRIEAVERKNRMLEKALIAVIRGTVGNDQRQTELQRANSLEEILRQLRMVDPNTPTTAAASAVSTEST